MGESLHYPGGSLNLAKCFWFAMYWQWHQERPQCRAIKANDPTVRLTSGSNSTMTPIENHPLAKASNFSKHLKVMKANKADNLSICIKLFPSPP
jgi:hypothetical protein